MKKSIGTLSADIYALLEDQTPEDKIKILTSVKALLGPEISIGTTQQAAPLAANNQNAPNVVMMNPVPQGNAKAFFEQKDPKNKGEELAVAALFRVDNGLGDVHTKDDLKNVIKVQARRTTFDEHNFVRDMKNAMRQAGFFLKGDNRGEYVLSGTGEDYARALPDREAAAQIQKRKTRKKPKSSKPKKK